MSGFHSALDRIDPRAKGTRLRFYDALVNWSGELDESGVPPQAFLVAEARVSSGTFYEAYSDHYRSLLAHLLPQPSTSNRCRRAVQEAKELTAEPWIDGWQHQLAIVRMRPQLKAEALVGVCVGWALRYPRLAVMDRGALPVVILTAARACFGGGDRNEPVADLGLFLGAIREAVTWATEQPYRTAQNAVRRVEARLVNMKFDDVDLEQRLIETYHMVAEYMLLARGRYHEANPALVDLLERASEELRATLQDPGDTEDTDWMQR